MSKEQGFLERVGLGHEFDTIQDILLRIEKQLEVVIEVLQTKEQPSE